MSSHFEYWFYKIVKVNYGQFNQKVQKIGPKWQIGWNIIIA